MPEPVRPGEGLGVLHLFLRVDRAAASDLPASAGKDLAGTLEGLSARDDVDLHLFSALGHRADIMVIALAEDLSALREVQTALAASEMGPALQLPWSYLSLTEISEYTTTPDQYREALAGKEVEGEDLERRVASFAERIQRYNRNRLHPELPPWEVACFYPMSHRRGEEHNWYALPFDERKRLMHGHGRSAKAFTGQVVQMVTGSTGLDDWEWGVTLVAHDPAALHRIVYELRFDEASSRYGEFGPFVVGLRRGPEELVRELGLLPTGP